jgi:tetratricopeptide (TPR) repeat protein
MFCRCSRVLLLCAVVASCLLAQNTSAPELDRARVEIKQAGFDSAIRDLQSYLAAHPNDADANLLLGAAYYGKHDYVAALPPLQLALKLAPEDHEAVKLLGLDEYYLAHPREAIPYLEQVRNWMPGQVDLEYLLTVCYLQTGDLPKARIAAAHMLGVTTPGPQTRLVLARILIQQQLEPAAVSEIQQALNEQPGLPLAHFMLGEMYIFQGKNQEAIAEFGKEIAINPTFERAFYRMGDAQYRLGQVDAAKISLSRAIWLDKTYSGPYILMAKILLQQNDPELAGRMLQHALLLDPNNYDAHYLLGRSYQQLNRNDDAQKEFEVSRKLHPAAEGNFGTPLR